MTNIQAVQTAQPVQYVVIPAQVKEDKNFFEGLMWGANGITNAVAGISLAGSTIALDTLAIAAAAAAASQAQPVEAVACLVGVAALNVLAYYVVKAEFSIASKSFNHMANTIL